MLDHLLESAGEMGATLVRLDTAAFMVDAHRLYRSSRLYGMPTIRGNGDRFRPP
jgi:hypothetical protein